MKRASSGVFEHASHAALVLVFLAATVWYLYDAIGASKRLENVIFVAPVAIIAIALALYILVRLAMDVRGRLAGPSAGADATGSGPDTHAGDEPPLRDFATRWRAPMVAGLFAVYVVTMDFIGFDVGSFVFIAGCLFVQGERRPLVFIGYPLVFAALVTYAFRLLVPYPFFAVFF